MYVEASSISRKQSFGKNLFNLTFTDCNSRRSCVSCLAAPECSWCGQKCMNPSEQPRESCERSPDRCASFDTGTTKLLIPFTAHRQQAPLLLSMINPPASISALQCMLTIFNGRLIDRNITVPYQQVNSSHANCVLGSVFNLLAPLIDSYDGQIQTNLRLYDAASDVFIDSNSNGKLALLFYKCEMKAGDCSQCLSVNPQLSCMWCQQISGGKPSCR